MPGKKDNDGRYRYRKRVRLPDGSHVRISGCPTINTQKECDREEREHIERAIAECLIEKHAPGSTKKIQTPTLSVWFRGTATGDQEWNGRFWKEFVIGEKSNREGTRNEKRKVFEQHLEPALGSMRLDLIDLGVVNGFRADLKKRISARGGEPIKEKTRANIVTILATALRYAESTRVIDRMPPIKVKAVAPQPIECWDFDQYGRLVGASEREGDPWTIAVLLAGDCGLRIGEIIGLEWPDVDWVGATLTIARQVRQGIVGPPKGGKSRTVPLTQRLLDLLRGTPRIRTGRVVARLGEPMTEGEAQHACHRVCRYAGLPEQLWHRLRHTYATHAALLGVNPIRLQYWLGHSTLNQTLRYVHFSEAHAWPIPDAVDGAGARLKPDQRIVAQLNARPSIAPAVAAGQTVGKSKIEAAKPARRQLKSVGDAGIEPDKAIRGNR